MIVKTKEEKQVYLYTDLTTFNTWKLKEDRLFEIVSQLQNISHDAIGPNGITDYKSFLSNPKEYLVSKFFDLFASMYPPHINKEHTFETSTQVEIATIDSLKNKFDKLMSELNSYAPTITKNGLSSNLEEEQFFKYLNPNKSKEYYALVKFLESANALKEFGYNHGDINLMKYAYDKTNMVGVECKLNLTKFI